MIFLGILMAAAAVGVGIGIIAENSSTTSLSVFGEHVPGVNTQAQVFLAGVLVAIVFAAGLTMAVAGLGRSIRVRRELRDLREEHRESLTTLELEKQQLQRELARARSNAGTETPTRDVPVAGAPRDPMSPFFDRSG